MAIPVWPPGLPQNPQKGYSETGGVLIVRTPQDAGPAKMRRRGERVQELNITFLMTTAQVTLLEYFVKITLNGTARFNFTHPRLNVSKEVRIVPQGEGDLYTLTYEAPGYYHVQLKFEVLP